MILTLFKNKPIVIDYAIAQLQINYLQINIMIFKLYAIICNLLYLFNNYY